MQFRRNYTFTRIMQILFLSHFDRRTWTWFEIPEMCWILIRNDQIPVIVRSIFEECEEIGLTDKLEPWQLPCAPLRDNDAGWTDVSVEELTVAVEKQQGLRDLQTATRERNPLTFITKTANWKETANSWEKRLHVNLHRNFQQCVVAFQSRD